MAYVPNFENDIFISYARENDDPLPGGGEGWVTHFKKHLENRVCQLLGAKDNLKVWKDDLGGLAGNDILDQSIFTNVKRSAVMVSVLTPGYLNRQWCREELEAFAASSSGGVGVQIGNKLRLFKVVLIPVALERQFGLLGKVLGYEFTERNPPENCTPEYWFRGPESPDQRFMKRLCQLADEVSGCLQSLKEHMSARVEDEAEKQRVHGITPLLNTTPIAVCAKNQATVYLAQSTEDLVDDWLELKDELEQNQIRVLPAHPLPNLRGDLQEEVERMLAESDLSVHLFGKSYGMVLADDPSRSISHLQYELAHQRATMGHGKSKFPRIGWLKDIPLVTELKSLQQKQFLKMVEEECDTDPPLDLQRGSLERLKETLRSIVAKPEPVMPEPVRKSLIYVTGQRNDLASEDAKALIEFFRGRRHDVFWPATTADDSKREKQDAMYMEQSDGLVIVYGNAPADWVQEKALDVRQRSRRRRKLPLVAAVYDAPPAEKEELPFKFDEVPILNGRCGLQQQELRKFLERVEHLPPDTAYEEVS